MMEFSKYPTRFQGQARKLAGITLVELMFVLVIVGILLALAYPSYVDYVRKGKRGDAQHLLMNWAVNQEIFRSNNPTYAADDNAALPAPTMDYYGFEADDISATTYTLTATATGDQANDEARDGTNCGVLVVTHAGAKTPVVCWQ
ncbi:MAG TPA: type IV pilin protein [Xanthomonadales bacterium]|nr:type IV pilin protein [Xanthomonadales bacterium]